MTRLESMSRGDASIFDSCTFRQKATANDVEMISVAGGNILKV